MAKKSPYKANNPRKTSESDILLGYYRAMLSRARLCYDTLYS